MIATGPHHWLVTVQMREVKASIGAVQVGVDKNFTLLSGERVSSPNELDF